MFKLIADDPRFVVIDKAPGVSFHQEENQPGLPAHVRQALDLTELYPVHRLDKATSGLMVLAKTTAIARELSQAFADHRVEKRYVALSDKTPKKKQGWIKGDMIKGRNGQWRLAHSQANPAITWFMSRGTGSGLRLFLLRPFSGRTHQLRVAMKSLGSAILGDEIYNPSSHADRTYLHAWSLAFTLDEQVFGFTCQPTHGELFLHQPVQTVLADWTQSPPQNA